MGFSTGFVNAADKAEWRPLFDGYAEFYGRSMNDAIADQVLQWLLDPEHVLEGILVRDGDAADALFERLHELAAERGGRCCAG